ncbi:MAG: glycosyltransferase family 87 protein [Xanthobacteraceae bacterium]
MDRALTMLLRSGDWLTRERIRLVAGMLLIASTVGFLFLVVTAHDGIDRLGRPLGTDFSNVYAAGTYVLDGNPDAPFDPPQQYAREQTLFGAATPFYGWHYPPYFLFIAGALAKMSYGTALMVWQASTLALYLFAIWAIIKSSFLESAQPRNARHQGVTADWLLLAVAFPAVLINVGHGQNGFLTAALLGGALVLLDRQPLIAGILFGLLAYKPQFGLMIPIALLAGAHWRSFAAAAATVVVLTLVTTVAFGPQVWHAFLISTQFSRTVVLEQGNTGWQKIQSLFSWARMWGAPIPLAYAFQGVLTVALGIATVRLWRSAAAPALKAAALCLAAILATPYTLDYDMMVLGPAIASFAVDGLAHGFRPWEKTALAALWLVPLAARSVAQVTLIPLGVIAMLSMFFVIMRRAELDRALPVALAGAAPRLTDSGPAPSHDIAAFE